VTLILASLILLLSHFGDTLAADADNPLARADTSSPRATLTGFVETLNQGHAQVKEILKSYLSSSRLYLSAAERVEVDRLLEQLELARRTLNLSELPAALAESLSMYRILQLKEVLDRLELPASESIPDAAAMESEQFKRWTLPGTEITIARVEQGPRAGEYLFSSDTVERLPEFYRRIKHLPYQPGATAGWYELYRYGGAGLRRVIPYKWMMALPDWAKVIILDQPVWRWFGTLIVLFVATGVFLVLRRAAAAWAKRGSSSELRTQWSRLASAVILLVLIPVVAHVLAANMRLSGYVLSYHPVLVGHLYAHVDLGGMARQPCSGREHRFIPTDADWQHRQPADPTGVATGGDHAVHYHPGGRRPAARHSGLLGDSRAGCRWYRGRAGGQRQPRQPARFTADHVRKTVPCRSLDKG